MFRGRLSIFGDALKTTPARVLSHTPRRTIQPRTKGVPVMSSINVLSESNFDSIVGSKPALIDFGAEWCVYCKKIAPIIEEIASEHPELVVGSIDVDTNPMLAARFRVHSLPTVLVMKDGQVVKQFLGAQTKETYLKAISEL